MSLSDTGNLWKSAVIRWLNHVAHKQGILLVRNTKQLQLVRLKGDGLIGIGSGHIGGRNIPPLALPAGGNGDLDGNRFRLFVE